MQISIEYWEKYDFSVKRKLLLLEKLEIMLDIYENNNPIERLSPYMCDILKGMRMHSLIEDTESAMMIYQLFQDCPKDYSYINNHILNTAMKRVKMFPSYWYKDKDFGEANLHIPRIENIKRTISRLKNEIESTLLSKEEAIKFLKDGYILTHPYFGSTEYIYQHGMMIFTEEGYKIEQEIFWKDRPNMNDRWSIKIGL